jgi:hypothetical protein
MSYILYRYTQIYYCNGKFHIVQWKGLLTTINGRGVSCLCHGPAHYTFSIPARGILNTTLRLFHVSCYTVTITVTSVVKNFNILCITVPTAAVFCSPQTCTKY